MKVQFGVAIHCNPVGDIRFGGPVRCTSEVQISALWRYSSVIDLASVLPVH